MRRLRTLLVLPPLILGVGLLYLFASAREEPTREALAERATRVAVLTLEPQGIVPRVIGYGTVAPARTWSAVPQVPGRIAEIHPELIRGGSVEANALLVRIAPETYEAAVAQARASLAVAEAQLRELSLTKETVSASLEIEREALALAERELDRQASLAERGTVSQATLDAQRRSVLQQRARVQELQNQLELLPAKLDAQEQNRRVAEANLRVAELDLARTEIRAPFPARVAMADAQIQQFVAAGQPLATLDGIARAEIDAQIAPPRMAGFIRLAVGGPAPMSRIDVPGMAPGVGLSATVRLGSGIEEAVWKAEVTRISDMVDPETRSVGVIVSVKDPYGEVLPGRRPPLIKGMFTEVELTAPMVEDRLLVPRSAVREGRLLIVNAEDRLAFAPVEILYRQGDIAVLSGGVAPGTRVVVSDPSPAIEGMLLDPEPAADVAARIARDARPGEAE